MFMILMQSILNLTIASPHKPNWKKYHHEPNSHLGAITQSTGNCHSVIHTMWCPSLAHSVLSLYV